MTTGTPSLHDALRQFADLQREAAEGLAEARKDERFVKLVPLLEGLTPETFALMMMDTEDALKRYRAALEELLDVAERIRGGDTNLDPERWYAARDYARVVLKGNVDV